MATTLGSTFDIVFDGPTLVAAGLGDVRLSTAALNLGPFTVVGMEASGVNSAVATLTRVDAATGGGVAGTVAAATILTTGGLSSTAVVTTTNQVVEAGQDLLIVATTQNVDRVVVKCRHFGEPVAQAIT